MSRECQERFSHHRLQRKALVSHPGMHQGTCVTHAPWYLSESLTRGWQNLCVCSTLSLTHWGRSTHICVSYLAIIGPDNGLSPGRRQTIFWINAGILLIGPLGTNFSEFFFQNSYIFIQENALKNVCRMESISFRPRCVNAFRHMLMILCYDVTVLGYRG